ncbi:MAG: hypothetical protein QM808_17635 [Steroidobacteraceae bacterium]
MTRAANIHEYTADRRAELQARCERQRQQLGAYIDDIELRVQGTDSVLSSVRSVVTRPTVLAGGLALALSLGRSGWWPLISRGAVLFAAGRRIYRFFKSN